MKLGIIGGTGWLGGAIAKRLLGTGHVAQGDLWLSNRSGKREGFEAWPDVMITDDSAALITACDVVVLAVRPEQLAALGVDASTRLVISVMASTSMARLAELTGASRIIRTMPSPATEHGEGFTPWFASDDVTDDDRAHGAGPVRRLRHRRRSRQRGSDRLVHGSYGSRARPLWLCCPTR